MPLVAQVAVSGATIHFDKLYSYLVPQSLAQRVHTGSMVLVPFGRGSKARMGVVLAAGEEPEPAARLKALYDAAPEEARLSSELLALVHALRESTFCTYYEAVKAIIPYGAQYRGTPSGRIPVLQPRGNSPRSKARRGRRLPAGRWGKARWRRRASPEMCWGAWRKRVC